MSGGWSGRDDERHRGGQDWVDGVQWVVGSHLQRLLDRVRPPGGEPGRGRPAAATRAAATLRIGDAERDRVAEALHTAVAEGRLTPDELGVRLAALWSARTAGELAPLLADLPVGPDVLPGPVVDSGVVSAYLRHVRRSGAWEVPPRLGVVVTLGSVALDLTQATVRSPEIVLDLAVTGGTVAITVPPGVPVVVTEGLTVLGGWDSDTRLLRDLPGASVGGVHGVARIRVTGTVVGGRVSVRVDRAAGRWRPFRR